MKKKERKWAKMSEMSKMSKNEQKWAKMRKNGRK